MSPCSSSHFAAVPKVVFMCYGVCSAGALLVLDLALPGGSDLLYYTLAGVQGCGTLLALLLGRYSAAREEARAAHALARALANSGPAAGPAGPVIASPLVLGPAQPDEAAAFTAKSPLLKS